MTNFGYVFNMASSDLRKMYFINITLYGIRPVMGVQLITMGR